MHFFSIFRILNLKSILTSFVPISTLKRKGRIRGSLPISSWFFTFPSQNWVGRGRNRPEFKIKLKSRKSAVFFDTVTNIAARKVNLPAQIADFTNFEACRQFITVFLLKHPSDIFKTKNPLVLNLSWRN